MCSSVSSGGEKLGQPGAVVALGSSCQSVGVGDFWSGIHLG